MKNKTIASIKNALRAESKQGYLNTGAIGGFGAFLHDILPELLKLTTPEQGEVLEQIDREYESVPPKKREALFASLMKIVEEVQTLSEEDTAEVSIEVSLESSSKGKQEYISEKFNNTANEPMQLQYIKGVGPQRAKQLENLGIKTIRDLLQHYPRRYEIRTSRLINELRDGEIAVVTGTVAGSQITSGRIKVVKLNIEQNSSHIYAIWFNQVHIPKQFPVGTVVSVTGKVKWNKMVPELLATEIEKYSQDEQKTEIVPIYPETARLNSKTIRLIIRNVLNLTDELFPELFPPEERHKWLERPEAIKEMHFPSTLEKAKEARERLVIEEILLFQLAIAALRDPVSRNSSPILQEGNIVLRKWLQLLGFKLTNAQQRVIGEIFRDMALTRGMTRLVQGDVGSGKTAVAMAALLQAVGSGYQGAMMVPTEVLALQHFLSLTHVFQPLGVRVGLLLGSQSKSEREQVLRDIEEGKIDVIVGTHALIQDSVSYHALGLVVTDEQHRFGVKQRTRLQNKGENPHVLVMTATPIPRSLALTLYGDLQLSILDEMPAGRKPVITRKITERTRVQLEKFLEQQISAGRQIFVVCPLVQETEKADFISATEKAQALAGRFPNLTVALLHGRMKAQEKEEVMLRFYNGEINILVSTTVVEVGVNVPNATVMVIENAERFGLAQLHQLRGRVGRGNTQSYCFLVSEARDSARLNILCETEDGFKIAEEDLKLRGPGELLGLRQHGAAELKLTNLIQDGRLVEKAYELLQKVINNPKEYQEVYKEVEKLYPKDKTGIN